MKNRLIFSALFALSLAACSGSPATPEASTPKGSVDNSSDVIAGDPNLSEVVDAIDNTPAAIDLGLNASITGWTGTKFAFNDPKEVEYGKGITSDSSGNVIVAGIAFPQLTYGTGDKYPRPVNTLITKLNSSGVKLWTRTLGSGNQTAFTYENYDVDVRATKVSGVVADPSGNIYVAGYARTALGDQSNAGKQDAFLVKYNPSGNIVWSRLLGAAGDDGATGIAINGTNIYLTGYACGNGLNFVGSTIRGACDVFVTKYESNGNRLWVKLFGSSGNDVAAKIAKVSSGGAVVVGTNQGAVDANGYALNSDGFVTRIDPNGNTIWNRTIATPQSEEASAVTVSSDAVYVGGSTLSNLNGVPRIRSGTYKGDAFLTKLSLSNAATQWTRYVAGTAKDAIFPELAWAQVTDLGLDSSGQVYAFGTGFNSYIDDTDVAWPVRYDAAGNKTADTIVRGYPTPDGNGSNAKVAMGITTNGVFLLLDDYLTKTPSSQRADLFEVFITKLGFDLKLR